MIEARQSPAGGRKFIGSLDAQFRVLHVSNCRLILDIDAEMLYRRPHSVDGAQVGSVGENLLRAAAAVEQTFGGITANLWDDPFEWTLPEYLSTPSRMIEYLEEVEATRQRAFLSFVTDDDLLKEIMGPAAKTRTLIDLLTETLVRAAEYSGRAGATRSLLAAIAGV